MFNRILTPCDGSDGSKTALAHAVFLAKKLRAELSALWVRRSLPRYPETIYEVAEEEEFAQKHFHSIKDHLYSVSMKHGIGVRSEIRKGHPAQQIVEYARQGDFNLIVLGGRRHSRLWGQLLGHTVERVTEQASCSVLIVRSENEEARYRKMLVGFDGSAGSVTALHYALRLAKVIGSQVQVLWIHPTPLTFAHNELRKVSDERRAGDVFRTSIKSRIDWAAYEHCVEVAHGYRLGAPARVLISEAQAGGFHLIVLGHSGHSGFWRRLLGGVADCISHQAHCDVLIVREPEE